MNKLYSSLDDFPTQIRLKGAILKNSIVFMLPNNSYSKKKQKLLRGWLGTTLTSTLLFLAKPNYQT